MLPNFLVIGPGKAGTTWMYHALKNHPEICMSSAKETLFFKEEFNRGIDWYSGFFDHCESAKAIGEVSNTYIFCSDAPERIKSVNPQMKLISCLRNPIERTFSHYLFLVRGGQFTGSFKEALEKFPQLIEKGKYFKLLQPYFKTFDENKLCIQLFDELKRDDISFIQKIYHFLDVDSNYVPDVDNKNQLSAAKPRNRWLALMTKKTARFIRKLGHPELISKIKYSGITKILYKEYEKKPEIDDKDWKFLKQRFLEDTQKLGDKLHKDLVAQWFE